MFAFEFKVPLSTCINVYIYFLFYLIIWIFSTHLLTFSLRSFLFLFSLWSGVLVLSVISGGEQSLPLPAPSGPSSSEAGCPIRVSDSHPSPPSSGFFAGVENEFKSIFGGREQPVDQPVQQPQGVPLNWNQYQQERIQERMERFTPTRARDPDTLDAIIFFSKKILSIAWPNWIPIHSGLSKKITWSLMES